jgi:hypothetical protein
MSTEHAHGPRPEVSSGDLEFVSDEAFDALVRVCQTKLAKSTWQHPNTLMRVPGGVTEEADDGQRVRRYVTEIGDMMYDLREYGGDTHPLFYIILASTRGMSPKASFDVDLAERRVRRIWQTAVPSANKERPRYRPADTAWLEEDLEGQIRHITKVIGRYEPLVAARSEADDALFLLLCHQQILEWSGAGQHGGRVLCLQRVDNEEDVVGIRFRGLDVLIEHLYIDEQEKPVHQRLEYNGDRHSCHVMTTINGSPWQPSLQLALEETAQTMFTIVRHVNNGLLVPYEAGPRRAGGFRVFDIMQHAAKQTKHSSA